MRDNFSNLQAQLAGKNCEYCYCDSVARLVRALAL